MERLEQISYNTYLAEKLEANVFDRAKAERADAMIHDIETSLETLASDIQALDSAYTSTKARNYIGFSIDDGAGLADRVGLAPSLLYAALILFAAYTLVFLGIFLSDKEKEV